MRRPIGKCLMRRFRNRFEHHLYRARGQCRRRRKDRSLRPAMRTLLTVDVCRRFCMTIAGAQRDASVPRLRLRAVDDRRHEQLQQDREAQKDRSQRIASSAVGA